MKVLAPGTRVRLNVYTIGGWIGKGEVITQDGDLVKILRDRIDDECVVARSEVTKLRKKPSPDLIAARAEIERLNNMLDAMSLELASRVEALRSTPTLRDQFAMAALTGLIAGHHKVNAPREAFGIADLVMAERAKVAGNGCVLFEPREAQS